MNEITTRVAYESDIDFLATMVLNNSRNNNKLGIFDLLFTSNSEADLISYLKQLLTSDKRIYCYYQNFLIATLNEVDIAILCNYEPRLATNSYLEDALHRLNVAKEDYKYISILSYCDIDIDKKIWMLDFLVQNDGVDSLDVAKTLVQKSLLQASIKGYRIVRTIVSSNKADVLLMYHRMGFDIISQKECDIFKHKLGENKVIILEYHI